MRAVLVVNPRATATTLRTRDVLAAALSSDLRVDTFETKGRGHAIELGVQAVETGADIVVALGGDGTVNEVVNGILSEGVRPGLPELAVVPGGSTNVFARALGMPASAVEATGQILEALREGRSRRIGLGKANDRWFTFCAGLGIDAAAVERVERKRAKGKRSTHTPVRPQRGQPLLPGHRAPPTVPAPARSQPARAARGLRRPGVQHQPVDLLR